MIRRRRDENHLSCAPGKRRLHEICSRINLETTKVWPVDQQLRPLLPAKKQTCTMFSARSPLYGYDKFGLTVRRIVLNRFDHFHGFVTLLQFCMHPEGISSHVTRFQPITLHWIQQAGLAGWNTPRCRKSWKCQSVSIKIWQIWVCGVFCLYSTVLADFFVLGDKRF